MKKIKLTKNNQYGKTGNLIEVTGTVAHGIIDRGEGGLCREEIKVNQPRTHFYNDKMMRSK